MKRFIKNILRQIRRALITAWCLLEVPLFLFRNRKLFKNDVIYVFWTWSFGHTITGLDYASRLYYPNKVSLVFVPHPRSNTFLAYCFQHNLEPFVYKSLFSVDGSEQVHVLRLMLLLISGLTGRNHVVDHLMIYRTVSVAQDKLLVGREETGQLEKNTDWTGYIRLVRGDVGQEPDLSAGLREQCRREIKGKYPEFFQKPFVTILLREKGRGGSEFYDKIRCPGSQSNYVPAVQWLIGQGYNVLGMGETQHAIFKEIPGYYSLADVNLSPELLNVFSLTDCALFVGQHSGPYILPNLRGTPVVLCDSMPYWIGTWKFNESDIIVFKHFCERKTGRRLSYAEVFKKHTDLAHGYHFKEKDVEIEGNSAEEICEAVKESVGLMNGSFQMTAEDKMLCDLFRRIYPDTMLIHYEGNRTSLHLLRQMKDDLLTLSSTAAMAAGEKI